MLAMLATSGSIKLTFGTVGENGGADSNLALQDIGVALLGKRTGTLIKTTFLLRRKTIVIGPVLSWNANYKTTIQCNPMGKTSASIPSPLQPNVLEPDTLTDMDLPATS